MKLIIKDNYDEMCAWAAQHIADAINNHTEDRPFILGLPTGSSPLGVYAELIRMNKAGEVTFKNVAYNCRFLAQALEFSDKYEKQINQNFIANIEEAVLLHDVGRVDKILSYEDKENCHELVGARFLEQLSFLSEHNELLSMSILVARTHNEKWDGSGLPHGIVGEDIPLVSRVFAVCNEFENACSKFR